MKKFSTAETKGSSDSVSEIDKFIIDESRLPLKNEISSVDNGSDTTEIGSEMISGV